MTTTSEEEDYFEDDYYETYNSYNYQLFDHLYRLGFYNMPEKNETPEEKQAREEEEARQQQIKDDEALAKRKQREEILSLIHI
mgnify:FL=1